jgi:pyruvate kinase
VLQQLFAAGATGARLTFSYGTPELQVERAVRVKRAAQVVGKEAFIVADFQGEKCRFSKIEGVNEIQVESTTLVLLTAGVADVTGEIKKLPLQMPSYLDNLAPGDVIVEGDGALLLEVIERRSDGVLCHATQAGVLHPGRGIVLRKSDFRPAALTEKDRSDLVAAVQGGVFDALALSFISSGDDLESARSLAAANGPALPLIAKIETALGVRNIEEIAQRSDMLMAARGDLAFSMAWEELPSGVAAIRNAAASNSRPWILATQLVEGLERFAFPTRAEICDLAHWMQKGAFGAMVSYETAFGPRPVDSVTCVRTLVDRYRLASSPQRSAK